MSDKFQNPPMAVCYFQQNFRTETMLSLNEMCAPLEIKVPQMRPGRKVF